MATVTPSESFGEDCLPARDGGAEANCGSVEILASHESFESKYVRLGRVNVPTFARGATVKEIRQELIKLLNGSGHSIEICQDENGVGKIAAESQNTMSAYTSSLLEKTPSLQRVTKRRRSTIQELDRSRDFSLILTSCKRLELDLEEIHTILSKSFGRMGSFLYFLGIGWVRPRASWKMRLIIFIQGLIFFSATIYTVGFKGLRNDLVQKDVSRDFVEKIMALPDSQRDQVIIAYVALDIAFCAVYIVCFSFCVHLTRNTHLALLLQLSSPKVIETSKKRLARRALMIAIISGLMAISGILDPYKKKTWLERLIAGLGLWVSFTVDLTAGEIIKFQLWLLEKHITSLGSKVSAGNYKTSKEFIRAFEILSSLIRISSEDLSSTISYGVSILTFITVTFFALMLLTDFLSGATPLFFKSLIGGILILCGGGLFLLLLACSKITTQIHNLVRIANSISVELMTTAEQTQVSQYLSLSISGESALSFRVRGIPITSALAFKHAYILCYALAAVGFKIGSSSL